MYDLTVILPTLNEAESIKSTILNVLYEFDQSHINGQILVVDDYSDDGTIRIVDDLKIHFSCLDILVRKTNHGLSQSLADGFQEAKADIILVTDADGQHELSKIPELYKTIKDGYDIAIGSRYIDGGGIIGWPWYRKLMSWGATFLSRFFFPTITDSGSGFFAIKKSVVINSPLKPQGFRMAFEILGKGNWKTVKEIPYTLNIRKNGTSKLKFKAVLDYIKQLWSLFVYSLLNPESHGYKEIFRLIMFATVGLTGVIVNVGALYILTEYANLWYVWATCIGIELSIITNFILNDKITFWDLNSHLTTSQRLVLYHFVSIGGTIIILLTTIFLTEQWHIWYVNASFVGIFLAFVWNFVMNRGVTWMEITGVKA